MSPAASVARVLIDSSLPQLDRLFDYRIPEQFLESARPGVRVRVPLRSAGRIADGILIEIADSGEYSGTLSDLEEVVSPVPVLAPEVWALARAVADRAAGTANDVVRLAVPKRQVRVEKAWLAAGGEPHDDAPPARAAASDVYPSGALMSAVAQSQRLAVGVIPLVTQLASGQWVGEWAVAMAASASHSVAQGRTAILCVPDYRDQEQLLAALADVLPSQRIVRLDARQSNPDRYRAMLTCLSTPGLAIVGNRSVVYAPAAQLGLIALWDDGDPLHREPLSPYVHSRDAALVRQQQQGCALFFFSHSRSSEVERLAELEWLHVLSPAREYHPKVVPTAQQTAHDPLAARARIPSSAWQQATTALKTGPVLIQVARPGYAPRLLCRQCEQSARCPRCEGPLGLRRADATPSCTWCGALAAQWRCENCDGTALRMVGQGAQRTAEDLGRAFPGVRVIVADGERPVLTVSSQPALVIATRGAEPLAEGGYRAVLLLDGERMLARESLRVGEDCLRWWSNAIALAARGATCMLVGVGGALASALATWRLSAFTQGELADRRRLRFPPAVRVATVTGSLSAVEDAIGALEVDASPAGRSTLDVLGPVEIAKGEARAIVRFDYAEGAHVARQLRASMIRNATTRRRRAGGAAGIRALPTLKVRFDDTEPFNE